MMKLLDDEVWLEVVVRGKHMDLTRNGHVVAVIIPVEDYREMKDAIKPLPTLPGET